jgi:hypothetical protein
MAWSIPHKEEAWAHMAKAEGIIGRIAKRERNGGMLAA